MRKYIWMDGLPVGALDPKQGAAYVIADGLRNPRRVDLGDGSSRYGQWLPTGNPFGERSFTGNYAFNLRFPGQFSMLRPGFSTTSSRSKPMSKNPGLSMAWAATVGSFAAPFAVMIWQAASSLLTGGVLSLSAGPIFLIGSPISVLATWLLGLPLVLYLRRQNSLNAFTVSGGGIVLGAIVFVMLLWPVSLSAPTHMLQQALAGGLLGLLVAVIFCLLANIPFRFYVTPIETTSSRPVPSDKRGIE